MRAMPRGSVEGTSRARERAATVLRRRALPLALLLIGGAPSWARAGLVHIPDLLPASHNSPLLVTPDAARLDASTGSVGHVYPIVVPPGTGEATPELALRYSSLTRASGYGRGWSLGLGRIERSTRQGPPSYTDADHFELDGELLVPDPRAGSLRFHRERTRFERIAFVPDAGGGWWSVTRPDGTELRFGSRDADGASSRLRNPYEASADGDPATADVFRWRLDEVVDPRGNAYRVDYEPSCTDADGDCSCEAGELCPDVPPVASHLYPRRIDYSFREQGALAPLQASRRVELEWVPRAYPGEDEDRPTSYRGGFQDRISRRLASITTRVNGAQAARWVLAYSPKTRSDRPDHPPFSQLRSIQRHGRDDAPFPAPTSFTYTTPDLTPDPESASSVLPAGPAATLCDDELRDSTSISIDQLPFSNVALTDLDGDGLLDRLGNEAGCSSVTRWSVMFGRFPDAADPARFEPKRPWRWYDADGGFSTRVPADAHPTLGFAADERDSALQCGHWSEVQVLDLDGDGRADLVDLVHAAGEPGGAESLDGPVLHWSVRPGVGDGFGPPVAWSPPEHAIDAPPSTTGPRDWLMYGRTLGFKESCGATGFRTYSLSRMLDVNGDGRPDHVALSAPGVWSIALNAGCDRAAGCGFHPPTTVAASSTVGGSEALSELHRLSGETGRDQADVDGDGLVDRVLVARDADGRGCVVVRPALLHTGIHGHQEATCGLDGGQPLYGPFASLRDVNGDGWLDRLDHVDFLDARVVHLGLGDGRFSSEPIRAHAHRGDDSSGGVDLDSDGVPEEVWATGEHGEWAVLSHVSPPGLLASITGELGSVTRLEYQSTARFAHRPVRAASPEYRAQELDTTRVAPARRHYWVVSRIEVSDGRSGTARQVRTLSYAGPRYDRERRENLGLRMAEVTTGEVTVRTLFHQDPARRGLLQLEETVTPGGDAGVVHRGRSVTWSLYQPVTEDAGPGALPIPGSSFAAATLERSWTADVDTPGQPRQTRLLSREYGWRAAAGTLLTRFGNLRSERDHGADGDATRSADDGLRTDYLYAPNVADWLVSYPAEISELGGDGVTLLGRTRLRYDGADTHLAPPVRGLVTTQLRLADVATGEELTEVFEYDTPEVGSETLGNVTRYWDPVAVAAGHVASGSSPSLVLGYDDAFRSRVVSSTNAAGHMTRYAVDALDGSLLRQLDPNGQLLCWERDGFGRLRSRSRSGARAAGIDAACDERTASFEFRTFVPGASPADSAQVPVDAQHLREVTWARGVRVPEPACDAAEPDCVEQLRYFDGLAREYFSAVESDSSVPPGEAGRFALARREWGPRGELRCEWLPARGPATPSPRAAGDPPCDASPAGAADRRVFEHDALLRVVAERHAGELLRSTSHVVLARDPAGLAPELVERVRIHGGSGPGDVDRYRELGRDRHGALVSVCEDPADSGACDPTTLTRITRDAKQRVISVDGPDLTLDGGGRHDNVIALVHDAADRRVMLVRAPDAASPRIGPAWRWEYDPAGNLRRAIPPRGEAAALVHHHDALGRRVYTDRPPLSGGSDPPIARAPGDLRWVHDEPGDAAAGLGGNLGRLTSEHGDVLTRRYDASPDGRRVRVASTFHLPAGDLELAIETAGDLLGRVTRIAYPDGEVLHHAFSGASLDSVQLERRDGSIETLIDDIRMHPAGRVEHMHHVSAGIRVERSYPDARLQRLGAIGVTGPSGPLQALVIGRDRAGNPRCITDLLTDPALCEQSFAYDGMHRPLVAVDRRDPETRGGYGTLVHAYDAGGRLIRRGDDALRYGAPGAPPDAVTSRLVGAHRTGSPRPDDPCPSYAGEEGAPDRSGDGIPDPCQCGDASGDGLIDIADILALGACIFDTGSCSFPLCDATGDDRCDVADVLALNAALFSGRHFELTCALRPEGLPVQGAVHAYAYDADGRLRERDAGEDGRLSLDWDDQGRLIGLDGAVRASHAYDASGQRVLTRSDAGTTLLVGSGYELDPDRDRHRKHVEVLGERVLTLTGSGAAEETRLHLLGDHLGSQRLVTDAAGQPLQRAVVTPYGVLHALLDAPDGAAASPESPFVFTGHRHDADAGLHYMGARYQDPLVGRFLSPDPALIEPGGEAWDQLEEGAVAIDAYAYARNRPGVLVDPDGRNGVALALRLGAPYVCRSACAGLLGGLGGAALGTLVAHRQDDTDAPADPDPPADTGDEAPTLRLDPETGEFEGVPQPPDPAQLDAHEVQVEPQAPPDIDVEGPAPKTLGQRVVEVLRDVLALVDSL